MKHASDGRHSESCYYMVKYFHLGMEQVLVKIVSSIVEVSNPMAERIWRRSPTALLLSVLDVVGGGGGIFVSILAGVWVIIVSCS